MRRLLTVLSLATAAWALAGEAALAADALVVVETASGGRFSGAVDGSSTPHQLVLSNARSGITLRRSIVWERIMAATIDGRPVAVEELRAEAGKGSGTQRVPGVQGSADRSLGRGARKIELLGKALPEMVDEESAQQQTGPPPRVTMVATDPYIANWDGDVETDGLVVEIAPRDWYGGLVAAGGTVEVELFAAQRRVFHHAPLSGGDTLELVERWTRSVSAPDFGPRGVQLRLPYGAIHPELRPDWMAGWYGLVHVKFTIPGHGVFEDSRDGVRVRPWAPNRDQLELNTGRRFVPTERLGRVN